jgi:single-strand DNA-binding protein
MNGTLNKVMLIGHLGDEIKMHYFDGGNCIGRFNWLQMKFISITKRKNHFRVA